MRLEDFPRPADDNGVGMHFGFDLRQSALDNYVPRLVELHVKWCLVPHADGPQLERAARALCAAGIMPISRWICHIDQNVIDYRRFVRILHDLELPAYVQIFNEPSDIREWRDGVPKPLAFISRWCDHAARVAEAGGYPGLQVLETKELRAVLSELKSRGADNVIERLWFCPHPYGANHPPDYPYDERNQYDHPGATIWTDDSGVLGFLTFAPVFEQELGFVPPFIACEGGWQFGNTEDGRYARIDDEHHAEYHAAVFNWFRSGRLSNGDPLPDYLFAFCPWILFGHEADAWYSWTTGTRQQTIELLSAMPPFTRHTGPALAPPAMVLPHYVWFGNASRGQRARLETAYGYLSRFNVPFGFSPTEAMCARRVTIVGDYSVVSAEDEAALKRAGCRVERLLGDSAAIEIILKDRLEREAEFG